MKARRKRPGISRLKSAREMEMLGGDGVFALNADKNSEEAQAASRKGTERWSENAD